MIHLIDKVANTEEERLFDTFTGMEYTIPKHIAKSIPMVCECGFLYQTNDKLTTWYCPNPYCIETSVYKLLKVFEKSRQKMNIGEVIARDIIKYNGFYRHMDVLCITDKSQFPDKYGEDRVNNWIKGLQKLRTDISLSDFVFFFQLDRLGSTTCNQIFAGKSLEDLEDWLNNEYKFRYDLRKLLNLTSEYTDTENIIVSNIKMFMPLFKYYSKYFSFKEEVGNVIRLCITGSITGFANRADLIPYLEDNYNITPKLFDSFSNKVDILLYEEDLGSTKIVKAKKAGKAVHMNDFWRMIDKYKKEKEED